MLNKLEWKILEAISYDAAEPFEFIDGVVQDEQSSSDVVKTLEILYELYKNGFLQIEQSPLRAFGQNEVFIRKQIHPEKPMDVVGDLWNEFNEYSKKRQYLNKDGETGIPFGIYIGLTDEGKKEIDKLEYKDY